ncbi:hypothetical protein RHCRD62_50016 [Rhodococcus sp. RD6.2]|uniref:alpha/beta fold hydrolase n=1 Tax=Rhodococcus sp. RD6.2 TaxID=260936 RepID=UPI00063BC396|nr:alpha/beta hydrolase [Rhodococcus sp. RD6.2]CRK52813.1 hypothetical protein RHCRD62_50016 [Rhodococcus sp. RD6.2]
MKDTTTSIELEDGRQIGFAEFGDPTGRPCFFVHGYSSSRSTAGWTMPGELLERHASRIIAIDRPHYGLSSSHPAAPCGCCGRSAP